MCNKYTPPLTIIFIWWCTVCLLLQYMLCCNDVGCGFIAITEVLLCIYTMQMGVSDG